MKKRMEPLTVITRDGTIWIEQLINGDGHGVAINTDQLPMLFQWLTRAAAELNREQRAHIR